MNIRSIFKIRFILISLFVVLLAVLIFIFRSDVKTLSIIFVTSSGLAVIIAIIFEGELKIKKEKSVSKLTGVGLFLIILSVFVSIGNGVISYNSISDSETKAYNDSITSSIIISELKTKAFTDSSRIAELELLTINNGLKSDSIKLAVVDNAVKAMDERSIKLLVAMKPLLVI